MKFLIFLSVSIPLAAAALETAPQAFPDLKVELPPLSLVGDALQRIPDFVRGYDHVFEPPAPPTTSVSRMPIVPPRGNSDSRMVRAPDPSTDYSLLTKPSDIQPAR